MKCFYYTVLLTGTLLICLSEVCAQTLTMPTYKSGELEYDLYSIWFLDEYTGFGVGMDLKHNRSLILRTEDAGATWCSVEHPYLEEGDYRYLYDICFSDPMNGWAVGQRGWVLHTTDGGKKWVRQSTGDAGSYFSVYCVDASTAWIGSLGNRIFRTTNSGNTWEPYSTGITSLPDDFYFFNSDSGYAALGWRHDYSCGGCGEIDTGGFILRTTDGGINWTIQQKDTTIWGYRSVYFFNDTTGFVTGTQGTILRTDDGGLTWSEQTSGTMKELWNVFFVNADTGFVVGGDDQWKNGIILSTFDGGATWTEKDITTTYSIFSIFFTNESTGRASAAGGTWFYTNDYGKTWEEHILPYNPVDTICAFIDNISVEQVPMTRIYPNPTENVLTIETENTANHGLAIEILDVTGKVVFRKDFKNGYTPLMERIDVSGYSKGIYLVKVKSANAVYVSKVILR